MAAARGSVDRSDASVSGMTRLYLSPPHMGDQELDLIHEAFRSNWVGSSGPHIEAFEREFSAKVGSPHAVALSSGTAP